MAQKWIFDARRENRYDTHEQNMMDERQAERDRKETAMGDRLDAYRERGKALVDFHAKQGNDREKAAAQREVDRLQALKLQLDARRTTQGNRADMATISVRDYTGSQRTLRVPQSQLDQMMAQGRDYLNQFTDPRQKRDAADAMAAANTTGIGAYVATQLYRSDVVNDYTGTQNPNAQRGQSLLSRMTPQPPVFSSTPSSSGGTVEAIDTAIEAAGERLRGLGGAGTPPTLGAQDAPPATTPPPSMTPSNTAPAAKAPLTKEVMQHAGARALAQLKLSVPPTDASGRQQLYQAMITLLKQQGYSDQELTQVPKP